MTDQPALELVAKSGEQCGAIEDPKNPGYAAVILNCEYGFKCVDSEGDYAMRGAGQCEKVSDAKMAILYNDYEISETYGDAYVNTEYTEYDQTIEDAESEPRTCDSSRKGLVLFWTENYFIEWAPACDDYTPELFKSVQAGFEIQKDVLELFSWCVDTASGKRLNDVTLASLFDKSICE